MFDFERARRIADAVLLEGYVLYPYRASAAKNRWRWSVGVLAPRAWSEAGGCEPWWFEAQVLVAPAGAARLAGRLRFLQVERREVEEAVAGAEAAFRPVESLDVGGALHLSWDEGEVREITLEHAMGAEELASTFELPGAERVDLLPGTYGAVAGRVLRRSHAVSGRVLVHAEPVAADRPLVRVRLRVENLTPWDDPRSRRDAVLPASLLSAHLLLGVDGGAFVSLLDPPAWASDAAAACRSVRSYPVLAGEPGDACLVLAAPIALYDHPRLAPESPGDFFDATEIDELLALRTATLTDDEQREARATDPRAAALLDRVAALPPELLGRLHGALRDVERAEMAPRARGEPWPGAAAGFRAGDKVRLRPGARRADAQDLLYAGRAATVREVKRDVDDGVWLAVTVDGDPAAELHEWYGRFHYFRPDEVERVEANREATP